MAIIDLQRRLAEAGRIRIGQQVESSNGKKRPAKLTTFRLTSADRMRITQAAQLFGGAPAEWDAPSGQQWEVVTDSDALDVIVPPSDIAFSQFYEQWSGGGCQRRCDGQFETISDGPCLCDPDARDCAIHTRLSVMLRDLPGMGVWRVDTQGYYAAVELQGAVEVIRLAAGRGEMLPARLRLEQRMVKRPGQGTRRFAVPVLDVEVSPGQLLGGGGNVAIPQRETVAVTATPLTPVPDTVRELPVASVAEQATAPRQQRRRTAEPVPRTGVQPRTVAQAKAGEQPARLASTAQNRKMHACFNELKLESREERLTVTSHVLGRAVETSAGMTSEDASKLIDTVEKWLRDGVGEEQVREILNAATLADEGQQELPTEEQP